MFVLAEGEGAAVGRSMLAAPSGLVDGVVTLDGHLVEVHADGVVALEVDGLRVELSTGAVDQLAAALGEAVGLVRCREHDVGAPR